MAYKRSKFSKNLRRLRGLEKRGYTFTDDGSKITVEELREKIPDFENLSLGEIYKQAEFRSVSGETYGGEEYRKASGG